MISLLAGLVLSTPGIIVGFLSLAELIEEIRFKKNGIKTTGRVIGGVSARHRAKEVVGYYGAGNINTPDTGGGHFLIVEYETLDGAIYKKRTKNVYEGNEETLPVIYDEYNPKETMINGFYKVGNAKYFRIIAGGLWVVAVFSTLFLVSNQ